MDCPLEKRDLDGGTRSISQQAIMYKGAVFQPQVIASMKLLDVTAMMLLEEGACQRCKLRSRLVFLRVVQKGSVTQ
jgi:hypothetical protein